MRCGVLCRDLDRQEAEIKEKLKQEKKREERKNREAFSQLLQEDMQDGFIKPKMRWKVIAIQHKFAKTTTFVLWMYVNTSEQEC